MWKETDDFWLTLPGNEDESALLIALGVQPLRMTASFDGENDEPVKRKGHLDVTILSFDRKSGDMLATVVENTTGLRLRSQTLNLRIDDDGDTEVCHINEIDGIIF